LKSAFLDEVRPYLLSGTRKDMEWVRKNPGKADITLKFDEVAERITVDFLRKNLAWGSNL